MQVLSCAIAREELKLFGLIDVKAESAAEESSEFAVVFQYLT